MAAPPSAKAESFGNANAIVLRDVGRTYEVNNQPIVALSGVNLDVQRGEFVTLFGPSGCGKSTLLRLLAGLDTPDRGHLSLFRQTPAEASARKNIAWVPQSPALLPWLSVRNNALLSERVNRTSVAVHSECNPQDSDAVLRQVGLADFAHALPRHLSGGMRQRAAIARGFVQGAPIMLMDEPFSALDEITRDELCRQLIELWDQHRPTVIFVTHSATEAALLSDRVVVMAPQPGRIAAILTMDLPRPRTAGVQESQPFMEQVSTIRRTLRQAWHG